MTKPLMIAHRGDASAFPENTIDAFASAFDKGADGIELDIFERNNQLIIVHNYIHDRNASYPLLDKVLERFAGRGRIEIEVKDMELTFLRPLELLLTKYANADLEVTTSVTGLMAHIQPIVKNKPIGAIFKAWEFEDWMLESGFATTKLTKLMQLYNASIAHIPITVINPAMVQALHKYGLKAHTHLPHAPMPELLQRYEQICAMSVDQCTFDDIDLLKHIAATRPTTTT